MELVREERPDYRAESKGYESLTTIELLTLILGENNAGMMDAARDVFKLADCKLTNLRMFSEKQLTSVDKIDPSRAKSILASFELGRRISMAISEKEYLGSSTAIYNFMHHKMKYLEHEEFWILLMNNNYKLIKAKKISHGGLTDVSVDIRVIIKEALINNATTIACCHNHPSGVLRPSQEDDKITDIIRKACYTMRIYLIDHIIVSENGYYSYRDEGIL